ncbi:MAG: hypothetical protein KF708_09225 [Pirellulales bacterium]|nr:hypothetical protein [Pirellulales bacterium]
MAVPEKARSTWLLKSSQLFQHQGIETAVVAKKLALFGSNRYDRRPRSAVGQSVVGDTAMSKSTYFVQECPTCGRGVEIRVEYLGKRLVCQHCHGSFVATDTEQSHLVSNPSSAVLKRAEELLALAAKRTAAAC